MRLNLGACWPELFKTVKQLFLKVFKSGLCHTFITRAQCMLGIVPRQLQVFTPSFTKKGGPI